MKTATLDQAEKILSIFKGASTEQIQAMLESGLLIDLREANYQNFNRNDDRAAIREHLGLTPIFRLRHWPPPAGRKLK